MKPQHLALMIAMNLVWGALFVFSKLGTEQIPPFLFSALRAVVVALVLLPFLKPAPGKMVPIVMVACAMGFFASGLFYLGMGFSGNVSSVAMAIQVGSPLSVMLAVIFLGEKVGMLRVLAIAMAFSGVIIIGFEQTAQIHLLGVIFAVGSSFFYALGMLIMRRLVGVGTLQLQAWIAALSALPLLVVSAVVEDGQIDALLAADWLAIFSIFATAVGGSIIGLGGLFYLLQRYPVSQVSPMTLAAPVIGVVFGVLFMGDVLTPGMILGGAMTIGGAAIVQLGRDRFAPKPG